MVGSTAGGPPRPAGLPAASTIFRRRWPGPRQGSTPPPRGRPARSARALGAPGPRPLLSPRPRPTPGSGRPRRADRCRAPSRRGGRGPAAPRAAGAGARRPSRGRAPGPAPPRRAGCAQRSRSRSPVAPLAGGSPAWGLEKAALLLPGPGRAPPAACWLVALLQRKHAAPSRDSAGLGVPGPLLEARLAVRPSAVPAAGVQPRGGGPAAVHRLPRLRTRRARHTPKPPRPRPRTYGY